MIRHIIFHVWGENPNKRPTLSECHSAFWKYAYYFYMRQCTFSVNFHYYLAYKSFIICKNVLRVQITDS